MSKIKVVHYINQFFAQIGERKKQTILQKFVLGKL